MPISRVMPKITSKGGSQSYSSGCKVEVYHYCKHQPDGISDDADLKDVLESKVLTFNSNSECNPVVSSHFAKSNTAGAGQFSFTLLPTENWQSQIMPGDWVLIYLTNGRDTNKTSTPADNRKPRVIASSTSQISERREQTDVRYHGSEEETFYWTDEEYSRFRTESAGVGWSRNILNLAREYNARIRANPGNNLESEPEDIWSLRCLGVVDSVVKNTIVNPVNGAKTIRYIVGGQDFGKVFTNYSIMLYPWIAKDKMQGFYIWQVLEALEGNAGEIVTKMIKGFLSKKIDEVAGWPGGAGALQWYIPNQLAQKFKVGSSKDGSKFYDILNMKHIELDMDGNYFTANPDPNTTLWNMMKQYSNDPINEMFCEIDEKTSKPSVHLKQIPFAFANYEDKNLDHINKFKDLASVEIKDNEILGSSLTYSGHDGYNFFLMAGVIYDDNVTSPYLSVSTLQPDFPYINKTMNKRYGLLPIRNSVMFIQKSATKTNDSLLKSWNNLFKHWYQYNRYFEKGSMTIMGNPGIRLGKRLDVMIEGADKAEGQQPEKRSYYIESYVDTWDYPNRWSQDVTLTRGVYYDRFGQEKFNHETKESSELPIGQTVIKRN